MKNTFNKILSAVVMLLVIAMISLFFACGSRKKDTQKKEESVKLESSHKLQESVKENINIKKDIKIEKDVKTKRKTIKKSYAPIDPNKPASVIDPEGKKHELHNAVLNTEEIDESVSSKSKNSDNSKEVRKSQSEKNQSQNVKKASVKKEKAMQLDREAYSLWNLLWLLVPIGIWLLYKKYNEKIN